MNMQDRNGTTIRLGDTITAYFTYNGRYKRPLHIIDIDGVLYAEDVGKIKLADLIKQAQWVEVRKWGNC